MANGQRRLVFLDDDGEEVVAVEDVAIVVELEVADRTVAPERIPRSRGQHFDARARLLNEVQVLGGLSFRVGREQQRNSCNKTSKAHLVGLLPDLVLDGSSGRGAILTLPDAGALPFLFFGQLKPDEHEPHRLDHGQPVQDVLPLDDPIGSRLLKLDSKCYGLLASWDTKGNRKPSLLGATLFPEQKAMGSLASAFF